MARWAKLLVVALAAVVVVEVLRHDVAPPRAPSPAEQVDAETAPEAPELVLRTLDGRTVDLRSLRGRVVAVNFWATWCPPCRAEMPRLAEFWRARKGRCFELLGVAGMSPRDDTQAAARQLPFPVLFDEDGSAVDAWSVPAFPRTFVLDAQGRVRRMFRGMVDDKELAGAVDPLLPASCPAEKNG